MRFMTSSTSKWDPEFCERVVELGREGKSMSQIARDLGIGYTSLKRYQEKKPEFAKALKEAQSAAQAYWEDIGMNGATGKIPGFNATAFIFQMKNRFRDNYSDKSVNEHHIEVTKINRKVID